MNPRGQRRSVFAAIGTGLFFLFAGGCWISPIPLAFASLLLGGGILGAAATLVVGYVIVFILTVIVMAIVTNGYRG